MWVYGLAALAGAVGLWLLLPPSNLRRRASGAVLGLVAAGLLVGQLMPVRPLPAAMVFYLLAVVTVASAVAAVSLVNPVYCAVWFGLMLLGSASLLFMQGAQFLAVATIVVYAGAILVTFLFLLMLAQPEGRAPYDRTTWEPLLSALAGAVLVAAISSAVVATVRSPQMVRPGQGDRLSGVLAGEHVASLGRELFGNHVVAVEAAGAMLLVALIAAAVIVGRARGFVLGPALPGEENRPADGQGKQSSGQSGTGEETSSSQEAESQ